MRRISIAAAALAVAAVILLGFGCGQAKEEAADKAAEVAVEKATGEKVEIDAAGNVDASDAPAFVLYPNAKVTSRVATTTSEGEGTVWSLEIGEEPVRVSNWYRDQFLALGWTKVSEMESGESVMLNYQSADESEKAAMLAVWDDGKTTISFTYVKKK